MPDRPDRFRCWIYFPIVLALSWGAWLLAIATGQGMDVLAVKILLLVGLFGPPGAALILMYSRKDVEIHWDYWRRLVDPAPITRWGWRLIFFLPPLVAFLAVLGSAAFGSSFDSPRLNPQLSAHFPSILFFLLYAFFVGPLPEEMGWRGYWLDRWERYIGGFKASLFIGLAWAVWYIPLFLVKGYPLYAHRSDWLFLGVFFGAVIPKSFILTYIYFKNRRSTLAAVLFHFMINFTGTVVEIDRLSEVIQLGLYLAAAVVLIFAGKDVFFRRGPSDDAQGHQGIPAGA